MKRLVLLGTLLLAVTACIPSVNPFYTEKDLVTDSKLLGEWTTKDSEKWKFEPDEGKAYAVTVTEKEDKVGHLKARLFTLAGQRYLDVIPTKHEPSQSQASIVSACVVAGHLLIRVPQVEPNLQLAYCDYDWLQKQLTNTPPALAAHLEPESVVITASTSDLQKFIIKSGDSLFQKAEDFTRTTNSVPPAKQP